MIILGAGMSGCLAGLINPQATIYEAQENPPINHNAVLRFRDDSVSKLTGIPFKKVRVHKGIFVYGKFRQPDIMFANLYSQKVLKKILPRSIWNLEPCDRYIAPINFQEQLFDLVKHRVQLNHKVGSSAELTSTIILSTIPLPILLHNVLYLEENPDIEFNYQPIKTARYTIHDCDVHQTIYYPCDETDVYRATLTGNQLIVEYINDIDLSELDMAYILGSFGIDPDLLGAQYSHHSQQFGKIAEIDDSWRRQILYQLTHEYGIYSAGRFAIWKNILMDDVLQDLRVIKEMQAKDSYEHHRRY